MDPEKAAPPAVAVAARSSFHDRLIAAALDGLDLPLATVPAALEEARSVVAASRLLVIQHRWRGGEAGELLRALRGDPRTRAIPVVGLAPAGADEALRDAGADPVLEVPRDLGRLPHVVRRLTRARRLILHVDDSEITRRTVRDFLRSNGYDVESAADGREGLDRALELVPDMIVTDVEMPRMTGYDLCRAAKDDARTRHVPVLIVSSLAEAQNVERGFESGANDYITKPIDWNELLSRIEETFRGYDLRGRERILVVEDTDAVRLAVQQALSGQGFEVLTARDGDEGVRKALERVPDLIITDYEMPRLDGLQLFHHLKGDERTKKIPVMMMSARDSRRQEKNIAKAGVRAYLAKPFTNDKLIIVVERLLAERRLEREKEHLKHYVSDDAWAAAHRDPGQVRADEVEVSILFSDICAFSSKCEKLTARQIVDLLNGYFDALNPVIKAHHGSIDKFVGDCIMAVFHHRDGRNGAEDAVRAGLEMQRVLHEEFNRGRDEKFENRVGINTGHVVQGDIGSLERRDFTVIGDVVNIASRLEGAADHGTTLVSEETYSRIRNRVEAIARPEPLRLKGKEKMVKAYRIVRFLV